MTQYARTYGWRRDLPDFRDRLHRGTGDIAPHSDLTRGMPHVYDQANLGSCTANAAAAVAQYVRRAQGEADDFVPSRLAIYYQERAIDPTCLVSEDSGASLRDGAKVLAKYGVASEELWPYDVAQFAKRPPKTFYKEALKHRALAYEKVTQTHDEIRRALSNGYPIMFGFSVYESFESDAVAADGMVPMPAHSEEFLGGHAVVLVGHDDSTRKYKVRNSWGAGWGIGGYCWMPYEYVESHDLASDLWIVEQEQ